MTPDQLSAAHSIVMGLAALAGLIAVACWGERFMGGE